MTPATLPLPDSVIAQLRPPEDLTVSQWCDRNRYLSERFTFEPGYWRTGKTPYLREIMDATGDPDVLEMVFIKCARVGGTEAINNCILYTASQDPMPIMYVQPTREDVEDEFTGRIKNMIEDCQALRSHIVEKYWATKHKIALAGTDVYGAWPTNPQTMVRKTIGKVIFDEIDNAEAQAGYLGNSLKVLRERIVNAEERGLLFTNGTPTLSTAAGWRLLESSDFRRYHVPCPLCGFYQVLEFGRLEVVDRWVAAAQLVAKISGRKIEEAGKPTPDQIERYQLARYRCESCQELINHADHHRWMIDRGVWIPQGQTPEEVLPLDDGDIVDRQSLAVQEPGCTQWTPSLAGDAPVSRVRGYHINVLYSPFSSRTWSHTLAEYFRVYEKPDELRVFKNSWLAEPWTEVSAELKEAEIAQKRTWEGAYAGRVFPERAKIMFMGADVQPDRVYHIRRAHGPGGESWLIDEGQLYSIGEGDTYERDLDRAYALAFHHGVPTQRTVEYFQQKYGHADMPQEFDPADLDHVQLVRCRAMAVDSGYAARLEEVQTFCKQPGVAMIKGQDAKQFGWKRQAGDPFRISDNQEDLYLVNVWHYRERIHRLLRLPDDHPSAFHIHTQTSDDYIAHLCSMYQALEVEKKGRNKGKRRVVWRLRNEGARKDKLDCEVYGMFLADLFGVINLRHDQAIAEVDLITLTTAPVRRKRRRRPPTSGGLGSGYLG